MIKKLTNIMPDESNCWLFLGIAAVFFGVYQLSIPIAYIVLGILFILMSLVKSREESIAKVIALPIGEN